MANPEHVEIVRYGTGAIDAWREEYPSESLDISGADFVDVSLQQADLRGTDLQNAAFTESLLEGADLRGANATGAIFANSDLSDMNCQGSVWESASMAGVLLNRVDFTEADLSDADMSGSTLLDADFSRAVMHRANLSNAQLTRSRFLGSDMTGALVQNAIVTDVIIDELEGLPEPPTALWIEHVEKQSGGLVADEVEDIPLTGDMARSFFVVAKTIEVVWDAPLPETVLLAYNAFHAACRMKKEWPRDISFLGGRIHRGEMIFTFAAQFAGQTILSMGSLLAPFRFAAVADWDRVVKVMYGNTHSFEAVPVGGDTLDRLSLGLSNYSGFATARPVTIRRGSHTSRVFYDRDAEKEYDALHQGGTIDIGGGPGEMKAGRIRPLTLRIQADAENREEGEFGIRFDV